MTIPFAVTAAFILGFAAHRAGICTVKAVAEIITSRRAFMLGAFAKSSIWIISISVLGFSIFDFSSTFAHWPRTAYSIFGGILFGVGAAANGGCTFSTLTRLGDGDINFGATVIGWPIGAWIEKAFLAPARFAPVQIQVDQLPAASGMTIAVATSAAIAWVIWQAAVILPPLIRKRSFVPLLLAPQYRLSTAAALIAICNLVLYHEFGRWSFTSVILSSVAPFRFPATAPIGILWLALAFALLGIVISSVLRKSFKFLKPDAGRIAGHGIAGMAMGFGAAMIPGGNDSLILYGIPSLSPHALPAYASILAGVAVTLLTAKRFGGSLPRVYCTGDVCMAQNVESSPQVRDNNAS